MPCSVFRPLEKKIFGKKVFLDKRKILAKIIRFKKIQKIFLLKWRQRPLRLKKNINIFQIRKAVINTIFLFSRVDCD